MRPFIGSEVWVQPWHSAESIHIQFEQMKQYGMKYARIFLDWRHVEPVRGSYDFSLYDTVFKAAEKNGIGLQITLMHLNWLPRWRQKEIVRQDVLYDPEPENCKLRDQYVREVVRRYKDSKAASVWILANEPRLQLPKTKANLKHFRKFIAKQHSEPEELYKLYGTRNAEEIGDVKPDGSIELGMDLQWEFAGEIDWAKMETEALLWHLVKTKECIRKEDKQHLITVNPDDISKATPIEGGRDIWRIGNIVDFFGMSCHVAWHSARFAQDRVHQSISMFCDIAKSATSHSEGCFQVTELQAGTNYFSGIRPSSPQPEELTRWIWDLIGGGGKGIIYWLLNPRDHGFEGLEWGLNNQAGTASERTWASKEAGDILDGLNLFEEAKPLLPEVYLLQDIDSMTLGILESRYARVDEDKQNPRNTYLVADALCGAYCMLYDMGYRVGFVNGEGIKSLPEKAMLIAPNVYAPSEETLSNIQNFVEKGGSLLADGLFAAKDPYGNRIEGRTKQMKTLFGSMLMDFEISQDEFATDGVDGTISGFYLKGTFEELPAENVLARWKNQTVAAVQKGKCVYIGTQIFQGYFAKEKTMSEVLKFMQGLLPEHTGVFLKNPSAQLHLRAMDSILIITNSGDKTTAKLQQSGEQTVYATLDEKIVSDEIELAENGYQILIKKFDKDNG